MRRTVLVAALLLVVPALVMAEKKGDKKKDQPASSSKSEGYMKSSAEKVAAGDLDGALELAQKAVAEADAAGGAFLALGKLHEQRFELDAAIDVLRVAAEKLEGAAKGEALGRLAVLNDTRGMEGSVTDAEAAAAADADGLWPTVALARARAQQGKGDEAVALAEKAVVMPEGGAPALAALGAALKAKGDLVAAEKALRAAVAADGSYPPATLGLAGLLRQTGRAAEALPIVQGVLEKVPGAVAAYKESARIKVALGKAQDALGDASTAAAMNEKDLDAQRLLVEVQVAKAFELVAKGDTEFALQDLQALKQSNPGSAAIALALGKVHIARRQADLAIPELQRATELDPKSAESFYRLANTQHMMKGNAAAAVPSYEKALALDPGNVTYRVHYGAALLGTQAMDRATEELQKATGSPGYGKGEGWLYLGQAHLGASRYKDSVAALEKAAAITPDDAATEAYLAWAYSGLKDTENFKVHGAKARKLGWKEPQLLERLKKIEGGRSSSEARSGRPAPRSLGLRGGEGPGARKKEHRNRRGRNCLGYRDPARGERGRQRSASQRDGLRDGEAGDPQGVRDSRSGGARHQDRDGQGDHRLAAQAGG